MFARKRLDIGWSDLAAGLAACGSRRARGPIERRVERFFETPDAGAIACLSLRTGFDLYLDALALPRGSEVVVSALTIPDMVRIIEHHGLVPVALDVDVRTLEPRWELLDAVATERTRAVLVAHLFGARMRLDSLVAMARRHGWLVLEDAAQAFVGAGSLGHPDADVSMFSFGPIKTATALGGGVLRVRDARVLERMRAAQSTHPVRDRGSFARRVSKYAGLKALTEPGPMRVFAAACARRGKDLDQVVASSVRGFPADAFYESIRARMSVAQLSLLDRRLRCFDDRAMERRAVAGEQLASRLLGRVEIAGRAAHARTWWVFPVLVDDPGALVRSLRAVGVDATRIATLSAVAGAAEAARFVERAVYVPAYAGLPPSVVARVVSACG